LVDEDGFLHGFLDELWVRKSRIEDIDAELPGQVNLALKKGVNVKYVDAHYMGKSSYPGLDE
jgi:hypothetical protein